MAVCKIIWNNLLLLRPLKSQQLIFLQKYHLQNSIKRSSQLILNQFLQNNEQLDGEKWSTIRNEILTTIKNSNESNIDSIIIGRCCSVNKQFLALNYIKYLIDERKQNLNIATTILYFKLLYQKEILDPEDIKRIFQYYDDLKKKYEIFDYSTVEGCILALSLTNRWKECINLMEQNKHHCHFSSLAYTSVITAAFNNDEPEIAWSYLEQTTSKLRPQKKAYIAYINFCKRHFHDFDTFKKATDKIFDFWSRHYIYPHITIIVPFMEFLSDTRNWNYTPTIINMKGICQNCNYHIPHFKMSKENQEELLKYILNIAIVGKDIYEKTTPTELNTFLNFINQTKPYDVVIDGLNAAYGTNRSSKIPHYCSKELRKIVTVLEEQNKKVLVLGKRHMLKWSQKEMNAIQKNSYLFLTNNASQDDLFTIYAALVSGNDTYFMTKDALRDHQFILQNSRIQQIFRKWQITHQIMPCYKNIGFASKLEIIYPPSYAIALHEDKGGWHIPYVENSNVSIYQLPERWMCLRINKSIDNEKNS